MFCTEAATTYLDHSLPSIAAYTRHGDCRKISKQSTNTKTFI